MMKKDTLVLKLKKFNIFQIIILILILLIICFYTFNHAYSIYNKITLQSDKLEIKKSKATSEIDAEGNVTKKENIDSLSNSKLQVYTYYFMNDGIESTYMTEKTDKLVIVMKPDLSEERFKKIEFKSDRNLNLNIKLEKSNQIVIEFLDKFEKIDGYSYIDIIENSELIFKIAYLTFIEDDFTRPEGYIPTYY